MSGKEDRVLQWTPIGNRNTALAQVQRASWAYVIPEIADPRFVSQNLTMPIPPLQMDHLESRDIALHSLVPHEEVPDPEAPAQANASGAIPPQVLSLSPPPKLLLTLVTVVPADSSATLGP